MRFATQIFFTVLTLFGLLTQEYSFASESSQFSTYLFGCYESAEDKDSEENYAFDKQDIQQPKIGSGGSDEEEQSPLNDIPISEGIYAHHFYFHYADRVHGELLKSYQDGWRNSFLQPDTQALYGSRKLFG